MKHSLQDPKLPVQGDTVSLYLDNIAQFVGLLDRSGGDKKGWAAVCCRADQIPHYLFSHSRLSVIAPPAIPILDTGSVNLSRKV